MEKFLENPWAITIIGGIIVAIFIYVFLKDPKKENGQKEQSFTQQQTVTQTVIIGKNEEKNNEKESNSKDQDIGYLKLKARILFIEDDVFKKNSNLKDFGWKVSQINKVDNLDIDEIKNANIIFVDYKGVGEPSGDQGLGVVQNLREMYGKNKWIIFYSAHKLPLDVYGKGADDFLAKNATVYEMERKIIKGAQKIVK